MPFTVSHVAAVLPVVGRRHDGRIVPAAWVIGSMVPDVPWFFTGGRGASYLHSLPGLVTADLVIGLVVLTAWQGLLAAPVCDLLPPPLGRRIPPPTPVRRTRWGWAALGVVLGATTHLVWDDFTHPGRWTVSRIGWLHTEHAGLLGAQWAQYASGLGGGVVVLAACIRLLTRAAPGPVRGWVGHAQRWGAPGVVLVVGLLGASYGARTGVAQGTEVAVFRAVTRGGAAAAGAALLVCLAWWLRRPRQLAGERQADLAPAPR